MRLEGSASQVFSTCSLDVPWGLRLGQWQDGTFIAPLGAAKMVPVSMKLQESHPAQTGHCPHFPQPARPLTWFKTLLNGCIATHGGHRDLWRFRQRSQDFNLGQEQGGLNGQIDSCTVQDSETGCMVLNALPDLNHCARARRICTSRRPCRLSDPKCHGTHVVN